MMFVCRQAFMIISVCELYACLLICICFPKHCCMKAELELELESELQYCSMFSLMQRHTVLYTVQSQTEWELDVIRLDSTSENDQVISI